MSNAFQKVPSGCRRMSRGLVFSYSRISCMVIFMVLELVMGGNFCCKDTLIFYKCNI